MTRRQFRRRGLMPTPKKLPVWRTVWQAYRTTFGSLGLLFRISWLWLLIMIPMVTFCNAMLVSLQKQGVLSELMVSDVASQMSLTLLSLLGLSSISVAWMRWLLIRERVTARAYLRLDGLVLRFIPFFLLVSLVSWGWMIIPMLPWNWFDAAWGMEMYGVALSMLLPPVAIIFLVASAFLRLSAVLPAKALAMSQVTFADAWRATRENSWRLMLGYLVCSATVAVAYIPTSGGFPPASSPADPFSSAWLGLAALGVLATLGLSFPALSFTALYGNYLLELTTTQHKEAKDTKHA